MSKNRFPNLSKLDKEEVRRVAVQCKTMRHFMQPESGHGWVPAFGYGIAFRCVNCGSWRFDTRSTIDDRLLTRHYDLSPEYHGIDTQSHTAWVSEYVRYLNEGEVAHDPDAPSHKTRPDLKHHYPKAK